LLRGKRTQTYVDDGPGQPAGLGVSRRAEVVWGGVGDQGRPDPLPGRRRAVSPPLLTFASLACASLAAAGLSFEQPTTTALTAASPTARRPDGSVVS
jgi:hypothetical protein